MKTVRKVPGKPRKDSKTIVRFSCEKYFSPNLHHFDAEYTKTYWVPQIEKQKENKKYFITLSGKSREGPARIPRLL